MPRLLHELPEWSVVSFFVFWSVAPAGLVAFAWRKWAQARSQLTATGEAVDNPAFLIGQILGTISCCGILAFYVPWRGAWDQVRDYGVIVSFGAALIALFILPFGRNRAKWLTAFGCVMNAALVVLFVLSLGD